MNNNSILLSLFDELKRFIELVNSLDQRISLLEQRASIIDGKTPISPSVQPMGNSSLGLGVTPSEVKEVTVEIQQHNEERPKASEGDVRYFGSLQRNEDGEYYVEAKELHTEPDNFRLVVRGSKADGYVCTDRSDKMILDFRKYLFPLRRPAEEPQNGCRVETGTPGHFELRGGRWYMEKKIVIKYLN